MARLLCMALCLWGGACFLAARREPSPESHAVGSCRLISTSQSMFHKKDYYKKGVLVYANARDGWGLYDLYELADGTNVRLIDKRLATALDGRGPPKFGYNYTTLEGSADGGPYDPAYEFAVCATPAEYEVIGLNMFVMDTSGTVYQTDPINIYPGLRKGDKVKPLSAYPSAADLKKHWLAVPGI